MSNPLTWVDPLGLSDVDIVKKLSTALPDKLKKNFKCKEYAKALSNAMKREGVSGKTVDLKSFSDFIYSVKLRKNITQDGTHRAIRVDDIIFDNNNPESIPCSDWDEDLGISEYGIDYKECDC